MICQMKDMRMDDIRTGAGNEGPSDGFTEFERRISEYNKRRGAGPL
jgi:hypothetical protein